MLKSIITTVLSGIDYVWGFIKWFINLKLKYKLLILLILIMLIRPLREFIFITIINIVFLIIGVLI